MYIDYLVYNWNWDDGMEPYVQEMTEEQMQEHLDWHNKEIVPCSGDMIEAVKDWRELNRSDFRFKGYQTFEDGSTGGGSIIIQRKSWEDCVRHKPKDFFSSKGEYIIAMHSTRSLSLGHWHDHHRREPVYLYQLFCHDDYDECMKMPVVYENTHKFLSEVNEALGTNYETITEFNLDQRGNLIATYTAQEIKEPDTYHILDDEGKIIYEDSF